MTLRKKHRERSQPADPREFRRRRVLRIVVTVTVLAHVPFAIAAAEAGRRAGLAPLSALVLAFVLSLAGVGLFFGRAKNMMNDERRPLWRTFLIDVPYFVHWCACIFCVVPSLAYVVIAPLVRLAAGAPVMLSSSFFLTTYAAAFVLCTYGATLRRYWFVVRRIDADIEDLDPSFDGYEIAHLSDLHIGNFTPLSWAMRWARAANAMSPDMVVITGDMVTSGTAFHEDIATFARSLRARDGVFIAMGNHDYFGEGEPLITLLGEEGARVLRNDGTRIERDEKAIFLAAVDDTWTKRTNMDLSLAARPEGMTTVLLAHDPVSFPHAAMRNVDLVLSGHTHGGQIALPFLARHVNMSRLAHRYHLGTYKSGRSTLYVHPGLGTTGPPIRLGVAPAVALVTLRARRSNTKARE
ncbi:MAG: metallophosphoesterase [Polyangiaceae bacterium]|nr:metallophosphoesterase [Polyangiaceae bacterium]